MTGEQKEAMEKAAAELIPVIVEAVVVITPAIVEAVEIVVQALTQTAAELQAWAEGLSTTPEITTLLDELAALAVDPVDIAPTRKLPRPPKSMAPVNKANYTANRPARRARSSCYIRRH